MYTRTGRHTGLPLFPCADCVQYKALRGAAGDILQIELSLPQYLSKNGKWHGEYRDINLALRTICSSGIDLVNSLNFFCFYIRCIVIVQTRL